MAVTYCGICGTDIDEYLHGPIVIPTAPHPLTGAKAPLVVGHEGAGIVVAAGDGAGIDLGTLVGLENSVGCGHCAACLSGNRQLCPQLAVMGLMMDGALAEAVNVPASMCAELPKGLPDEAGALAESLSVAVRAVRRAGGVAGIDVHVFGAGTIGLMTAQVARSAGARSVTLRDPSAARLGRAAAMGFEVASPGPDGARVSVVFECTGTAAGMADSLSATAKSWTTVVLGVHDRPREIDLVALLLDERVILASLSHAMNDDYVPAIELPATATATATAAQPKPSPKFLRVTIDSKNDRKNDPVHINVRVPIALLRAGVRLASFIPTNAQERVKEELHKSGVDFDISQIKPENLNELIDQLKDVSVDIDHKQDDVKIKIYAE